MSRVLAVINFIDRFGKPIDPDFGVGGGHPDQGLPGSEYPDQGLPPLSPGAPDQGLPGYPGHPSHPISGLPPWKVEVWPPGPVDPNWGVDGNPGRPSHPIEYPPFIPIGPDQGLPPIAGHLPAPNPPPGTIWPPLPPDAPAGKAALIVWLTGVGYRYVVVEIPPPAPSQNPIPAPVPHK